MNRKLQISLLLSVLLLLLSPKIFSAEFSYNSSQPTKKSEKEYTRAQKETFNDKLVLYIPNRIVDFADIFDVSLGFGPSLKAKVWATRYMSFGAGIGGTAKLIKGYNRQYGAGLQSGWDASFMMLSAENTEMYQTTRGIQKYFHYYTGVPSLNDSVYNFWRGPKDFFSIGAQGAVFIELRGAIHPFEIFDFVSGIFFIDPKGDDFDMKDIKS